MGRGIVFALALGAVCLVQRVPAAAYQENGGEGCSKFNRCRPSDPKEKVPCPKCGNRKIPKTDSLCSSCASKAKVCRLCGKPKAKPGSGKSGTVQDAMATVTAQEMREFLMVYAGDGFEGRKIGTPGNQKARAFLVEHLQKAGAKPLAGNFEMPWGQGTNVGTLYPGSDPKLKDEYVIVGSHLDHIGIGGGGGDNINNGADDNGSGTTTNLEICEALFTSGIKTRRSIINLWFDGEESGLLGSAAYTRNPPIPNEKCVAMLNCDMLGRNPGQKASLWGVGSSPQFSAVVDKAMAAVPGANVNKIMEKGEYFHRSDQANFWKVGIPVMFISTGMHSDYHRPSDSPDKIAYERMAELGKFMLFILVELANMEQRPVKDPNYK